MKRFFILLFLAVSAIFQSFSASRPEISYQAGMVCFASRGIKRDVIAYSSEIQATGRNYSGTFGFQGYGGMIDFSLSGEFYPKFCTWEFSKRYIKLGVGAIYHFQNQLGIAYENDFIAKSIFSIVSKKNFIFEGVVGCGVKGSKIKALDDNTGWIYDMLIDTSFKIRKIFDCGADIFVSATSHDLYQFPTFISPIYTVGASYKFKTNLKPYCEISARMCDMFVTAPYLDRLQFKFGIGYSF